MATVSLAIATTTSTLGYPPKSHPPTAGLRPACAGFAGEKRRVGDPAQKAGDPQGIPGAGGTPRQGVPRGVPRGPPGIPGVPPGIRDFSGVKNPGFPFYFSYQKRGFFPEEKSGFLISKIKGKIGIFGPLANP